MAMESSAATKTADTADASQTVDAPEFIDRLAEDLRQKSGSDLPLSCFVEQVKMQLSGKSRAELMQLAANTSYELPSAPTYETSDCFKAWAMPE